MSVNLAKFFNFVFEDEMKKLEHEFKPFIYSVFLPSGNNKYSQNELILKIDSDSISPYDIIGHFDCFHHRRKRNDWKLQKGVFWFLYYHWSRQLSEENDA